MWYNNEIKEVLHKMKKKSLLVKILLITVILVMALVLGVGIGAISWIIQDTPDIANYGRWHASETTRIYSRGGDLISSLYEENRIFVPLSQMPQQLIDAVVSIEDARYYSHFGVDLWAIGRAFYRDLTRAGILEGGSTITQQLAKNALLTHDRTLYRKIQDAYLALQFERIYTKEEILEFYLNEIYLGHGSYGVQTASKTYFGKDVSELTLGESALLAGVIRAPYIYSPYIDLDTALRRRNLVLNRMEELEFISAREAYMAREEEVTLRVRGQEKRIATYFQNYIQEELLTMFDDQKILRGGLKVYTTLDLDYQKNAEETFQWALEEGILPTVEREEGHTMTQPQVALVTLDPKTGAILAMVGGRGEDHLNRAVQSTRQPGSAFKPFVYTAAINEGYTTTYMLDDARTDEFLDRDQINSNLEYWPRNYDDTYGGLTSLRSGLARSVNVMAVKLLSEVGIEETVDLIKRMGITTLVESGNRQDLVLPLALGGLTRGVTPLEMASAFGVYANQGIHAQPFAIEKVVDNRGQVIYEHSPEKNVALDEEVAYIMTSMLESVMDASLGGTGRRAYLGRPTAGKTGTTSDYTDAWFVGYTPDLVTSIWIGEDQPRSMRYSFGTLGSSTAVTLWGEYMRKVIADLPITYFERPESVLRLAIDPETGLLPNQHTTHTVEEVFIRGTEPTEVTTLHLPTVDLAVDTQYWLLASDHCPPDKVEILTFQQETGYLVDETGRPVREKHPQTNRPLTDDEGNYIYIQAPREECYLHSPPPELREDRSFMDRVLDLFTDDEEKEEKEDDKE